MSGSPTGTMSLVTASSRATVCSAVDTVGASRREAHGDAASRRGHHVDGVVSDPGAGDDAQPRRMVHRRAVPAAAPRDHRSAGGRSTSSGPMTTAARSTSSAHRRAPPDRSSNVGPRPRSGMASNVRRAPDRRERASAWPRSRSDALSPAPAIIDDGVGDLSGVAVTGDGRQEAVPLQPLQHETRRSGGHCRRARHVAQQRDLAERVAWPERADVALPMLTWASPAR